MDRDIIGDQGSEPVAGRGQSRHTIARLAAVLVALGLAASACSGSATVTETGTDAGVEPTTRPTIPAVEPTAPPGLPVEPTSTPEGSATGSSAAPDSDPITVLPVESFRTDSLLAISSDGVYAYAGTSSPWNNPTSCTAASRDSLAVLDINAGIQGEVTPIAGGMTQSGDIRQFVVGPQNSAAVVSSCGSFEDPTLWLQYAEIGADGRIVTLGEVLPLGNDAENNPRLLRWVDDQTVEVRVIVEVDPDDFDSRLVERRQVDIHTGEIVSVEQFSNNDDDEFGARSTLTTDQGVTYRVVDDPQGGLGCEGFGVARTLELDDGTTQRLALTEPALVFSDVSDLHTSPGGYIAWTSGCEGFVSAYVGKILDDGTIADAHFVDTFNLFADTYADFRVYRLTDDGFLVAVGQSYLPDADEATLEFLRYDLASDPSFVNTAEPAPVIDPTPLLDSVGGIGTWHTGETLAAEPACGASTLYGKTPGGFVRAFPAGVELDAIVAVDVGPTQTVDFDDGQQFISRTVVIQTECPEQYEGRRVWFGTETDQIIWGLRFAQADLVEVADVRSVRAELQTDSDFVDMTFVEVELLDGTIVEVELVELPFGG